MENKKEKEGKRKDQTTSYRDPKELPNVLKLPFPAFY